jgi:RNA polymerase sigma factor FliA
MDIASNSNQALVREHVGYVRALAARHFAAYASRVEYDDLVAAGYVGLCTAARSFKDDRGARFATYAHYRIHGAILDGVRRLRAQSGKDTIVVSAPEAPEAMERALARSAPLPEAVDDELGRRRDCGRLKDALARLPKDARRLLELHYYDDLSLQQAARKLGISKSWASRLHARALRELRRGLATTAGR